VGESGVTPLVLQNNGKEELPGNKSQLIFLFKGESLGDVRLWFSWIIWRGGGSGKVSEQSLTALVKRKGEEILEQGEEEKSSRGPASLRCELSNQEKNQEEALF